MITPAIHGSKYTRSSCRPIKYHGAFAGLGVFAHSAASSRGALKNIDTPQVNIVIKIMHNNTTHIKYGQDGILSYPGWVEIIASVFVSAIYTSHIELLKLLKPFKPFKQFKFT